MKLNWNIYTHNYKHIFKNFKSCNVIEEKSPKVDIDIVFFVVLLIPKECLFIHAIEFSFYTVSVWAHSN